MIKQFSVLLLTTQVMAMDYSNEGKKALKPLKMKLMKTLKSSMKSSGPVGAIGSCQIEAPKIADQSSSKNYEVGRSSLKYRSPKNKPEKWMISILNEYEKTKIKNEKTIKLEDGSHAYVEPIYVKGLCLNCHGTNLNQEVRTKLEQLYPKDMATNYKVNDFRGIFWVKFKN